MSTLPRLWSRVWRRVRLWFNWRQKIRTKLLLAVVVLCFLPLVVLTLLTLRMGTAYYLLDAAKQNRLKVTRLSELVDQYFSKKFAETTRLSEQETLDLKRFPVTRERFLAGWLKKNRDLLAVTLSDGEGHVLASSNRTARPLALPLPAWPRPTLSRPLDLEISQLGFDPTSGERVIALTTPLRALHGQPWGLLLTCTFGLQTLRQEVLTPLLGPQDTLFLEDSERNLILRLPAEPKTHVRLHPEALSRLTRVLDASAFSVVPYADDQGRQVLGAFARCDTLSWGVYVETSADVAFRRIAGTRFSVLAFSTLMMFFIFVAGVWFVSRLVQPLEDLEAGIKLVSSGLMGDELPIRSQDEIGRLTQTFNQMTRMLALRTEEIRTKTRELTLFNALTRIINQAADLPRVLEDSLEKILHYMHATSAMVYTYQPMNHQLKLSAALGVSPGFNDPAHQVDFVQGSVQKVYQDGTPQFIRDPQHGEPALHLLQLENLLDLLLVPLRTKTTTLGVLAVGSRRRHTFHYRDLDFLARVGDELGVAVENALLYDALQLKVNELQKANQDLQELDRFKTRFLSNISHELRTPITSIKTYIDLFLGGKIGPLDEIQKDKLQIVGRNLSQLLNLINDLLVMARSEDLRGLVLKMEPVLLPELVDQVIADTIEMARGKGLQLGRRGLTQPILVRADREKLRQVLQNLVSNAIKFTERGRITVEITHAEGGGGPAHGAEAEGEPRVLVAVTDTGIGIPAEEQGKVFQRFYQVDSSSTRKYIGSGLGLAIVKEILAAHHTVVQVESALGHGSRFWFTLPILRAET